MTYPGGKGILFRRLINLIPPHHTYIESHLGLGAVLRNKAPAKRSIGIEIDAKVLHRWAGVNIPALELVHGEATGYLKQFAFCGQEFVYADPPYVRSSRLRSRVYRYELDDKEHLDLLEVLDSIPAHVMVSGYATELYDRRLSSWRRLEFNTGSHGQARREVVWLNYEPPAVPFDIRYAGDSFHERQRIKRKQQRLRRKIVDLTAVERALLLDWISGAFGSRERR